MPKEEMVFVVEDNEVYAKSLQAFLLNRFSNIKEIKLFRIGEMCLPELYRKPGIIIIDYFLNSKHKEALNGLEIINRIKLNTPDINIIVLSQQEKLNVAFEAIKLLDCSYVQKGQDAFYKVEQLIKDILNHKNRIGFAPLN